MKKEDAGVSGQSEFWGLFKCFIQPWPIPVGRDSDTVVKGRSIILEIELTYLNFFYMYLGWSHFSSSSWPPIWFEALVTHHPSLLADLACLGTASDAVLSSGWISSDCCTHVHCAAWWHFRVPEISVSYGLV